MKTPIRFALVLFFASLHWLSAATESSPQAAQLRALAERLKYQQGQIVLKDGLATVNLSEGFRYVDPAGTETLLTGIWGNPSSSEKFLGMIVPAGFDPFAPQAWCVVIGYQEDGYVKDDDAEKINYTKLLKQMQKATREGSAERVKNGYPAIELIGWAAAPRYDRQTHKFYWAKELNFGESQGENTLNYSLRILGRRGILELNAVASMGQLADIEKATPQILAMVDFNEGHRYADYTPGTDKLAKYGLAALVAGTVAAKTGLLKGLFVAILAMKKFLIIGGIAIIGFVAKLFGRKKMAAGQTSDTPAT
jgi:uncharacterized membrane-anchored protein